MDFALLFNAGVVLAALTIMVLSLLRLRKGRRWDKSPPMKPLDFPIPPSMGTLPGEPSHGVRKPPLPPVQNIPMPLPVPSLRKRHSDDEEPHSGLLINNPLWGAMLANYVNNAGSPDCVSGSAGPDSNSSHCGDSDGGDSDE